MATLVIKTFPEELHARLKGSAAENRRSTTQQAIVLLERALDQENAAAPKSYWKDRERLPAFEEAVQASAFSKGTDSTEAISEEREPG